MYTVRKSVFANTRAQLFSELQVLNFSLLELQDLKSEFLSTVSQQNVSQEDSDSRAAGSSEKDSEMLAKIISDEDQARLKLVTKIALRYFEDDGYLPKENDFEGQKINCFQYKFLVSLFKAIKSRNQSGAIQSDSKHVTITREKMEGDEILC